jgi:hypothetical protein
MITAKEKPAGRDAAGNRRLISELAGKAAFPGKPQAASTFLGSAIS